MKFKKTELKGEYISQCEKYKIEKKEEDTYFGKWRLLEKQNDTWEWCIDLDTKKELIEWIKQYK